MDVLYDRRVKLILSASRAARSAVHRRPLGARISAHRLAQEREWRSAQREQRLLGKQAETQAPP
jgi:hypothetical protein